MKKYSVLTCIFDGYEMVREPINPNPMCEYILVTDDPTLKSDIWDIKLFDHPIKGNGCTKSFYVKYHPFEFVNTDIVMWIDGSVQILDDVLPVMIAFEQTNKPLAEMFNLCNSNAYDETRRWIENMSNWFQHNGNIASLENVLKFYEEHNYDTDPNECDSTKPQNGMVQTTLYMCRNNSVANHINNVTIELMSQLSVDDDYIREYMGIRSYVLNIYLQDPINEIMFLSPTVLWSKYFEYRYHGSNDSQLDKLKNHRVFYPDDYTVLFNWGFYFHHTLVIPFVFPYKNPNE